MQGFKGRTAVVDLRNRSVKLLVLERSLLSQYVGGRGISSALLYSLLSPGMNPLSTENILIFATGPLTGTIWPSACRYVVSAKSPLTGALGYSNAGGYFGPRLRMAGVDFIVVKHTSDSPIYLLVEDGRVEIRDAAGLWGLTTRQVTKELQAEFGFKASVTAIGPAGERLVKISALINDEGRAAARTGMGAVMGSKKLKAVVALGDKPVEAEKSDEFKEISKIAFKMATNPDRVGELSRYGTSFLVAPKNEIGDLPVQNHYDGTFEEGKRFYAEIIHEELRIKKAACFSCPIGCGRRLKLAISGLEVELEGMEYETIAALGSNCANTDARAVAEMNLMCNELGLDTISMGVVLAWAMECYERGLLTKEDTGGLEIRWGDFEIMKELICMTAHREGFGDLLAEGVRRASQIVGKDTEKYAMHVKGLEIPMQQPRAVKMFALGHATSNRGADHLYALPTICYPHLREEAKKYLGLLDKELNELTDIASWKHKARAVVFSENFCAIVDSLGICKFPTVETYAVTPELIAQGYGALVGAAITAKDLLEVGERVVNLERMFNCREGFSKKDDTLPERFTKEPLPSGPFRGSVVELEGMLEEYYRLRGWDSETGSPKSETISKLGIPPPATLFSTRSHRSPFL